MKKLILIGLVAVLVLSGCSSTGSGELIGVQKREKWFEPDPYGMVKVPMGSFVVGPQDEDITFSMNATSKTISVDAFWMDETEITNNEYRQFVHWVIDSMVREKLGEEYDADEFLIEEDEYGNPIVPPYLNWDARINPKQEEVAEVLEQFYIPENERFFRRKELDTRKLNYEYQDIDYQAASAERKNPQRQIMNSDKSEEFYSDS
ncbi:MAG: SUMF1/EgtB/PvdO family nonheme iron enzyme, partial [Bacteroidetes bacterium]|nr:SUMF1/EgtB/PvdO family nonheme iron enzyme [Bacteroidota bacterium]